MGMMINPKWTDKIYKDVNEGKSIDETIMFNKASQWLVTILSNKNIPFKVYNLGAGVKRITTETDICPCCKKKI